MLKLKTKSLKTCEFQIGHYRLLGVLINQQTSAKMLPLARKWTHLQRKKKVRLSSAKDTESFQADQKIERFLCNKNFNFHKIGVSKHIHLCIVANAHILESDTHKLEF